MMTRNWSDILPQEILDHSDQTYDKILALREQGQVIYPPQEDIFKAMRTTKPDQVRAVILGQDPYHGPGQAMGLSFSVRDNVPQPPSLVNIMAELTQEYAVDFRACHDLTPWAKNGVLLLNTVLTVEAHKANSHAGLDIDWQKLTKAIIKATIELPQPIVYLLWGRQAQSFAGGIPIGFNPSATNQKVYIKTSHPSPLSAHTASHDSPAFLGSGCFRQANTFLETMGGQPIDWGCILK